MVRLLIAAVAVLAFQLPVVAEEWGSVSGQFVIDGDVPEQGKFDNTTACNLPSVPDESLIVDPASKGIKNIFIYMRKAPASIHPDLKASKEKEVIFDQKGCQFIPHALILRNDQTIVCKSSDPIPHNLHTNPIFNPTTNVIVQPNDQTGIRLTLPTVEALPVKVNCDIHPFMNSYWAIVDHPYAVITDEEGKFKIENLPAGEHEFRVWHELTGYVPPKMGFPKDKKFTFKVKGGENTELPPFKVPAAAFKK
ncbi:hypothetical protein [Planctomicrobium sp. SH664]|uniref:hypothetical protein n=1 Tax=Planctomicrobium sp. SH664 TaxID=3448125 RepID=UPI003F5BB3C3